MSFAEPLEILENNAQIFEKLKIIIQDNNIEQILLGLSDRKMAEETKNFAQKLKSQINLPIIFWDESFSSKTTHAKLKSSGMKKSKRKQAIDHFAAASFLEDYLESNQWLKNINRKVNYDRNW